jgi:hypothetical protein
LEVGFWVLGFGFWVLGFWGLGSVPRVVIFLCDVPDVGFVVWGLWFEVCMLWFVVWGLGFGVQGFRFGVREVRSSGFGFRLQAD